MQGGGGRVSVFVKQRTVSFVAVRDRSYMYVGCSRAWASNPGPARLYYAARGHICKLCVYYKRCILT